MSMFDEDHPKGALAFTLIYIAILVLLWLNTFLDVWRWQ
jgi:hypothetical protein